MDGMLSQDEINALLSGMGEDEASDGAGGMDTSMTDSLSEAQEDAVGEVSNISMGTAATTLSALLNQRVNITTPKIDYATWDDMLEQYDRPCVFIQIYYTSGFDGNNILIMRENDVKVITDLMMGGDGTSVSGELTDMHLSAISEAMNQMMGSASTSLSAMLDKKIDISPPTASIVNMAEKMNATDISEFLNGRFVKVSFRLEIGDLVNSELMQLYSFDFARGMYSQFIKYSGLDDIGDDIQTEEPVSVSQQTPQIQQTPQKQQIPQTQSGVMLNQQTWEGQSVPYMAPPVQDVNISPVQFQPFVQVNSPLLQTENIDLLLDVPLEVTAELGRTSKSIKEILDFAPGTIIELNRLAGEPIDVMVNGKYVAKGEVVVIEEAFGIRVTEVVNKQ